MESEPLENEQTVFTHQQNETMDEFHRSYERAIETVKTEGSVVSVHCG